MFNRQAKVKEWWMGPDKNLITEGFDDLFQVQDDYKIPSPSFEARGKLEQMNKSEVLVEKEEEFNEAMDSVFGSTKKSLRDAVQSMFGKKEEGSYEEAPASSAAAAPLRVVQHATSAVNIVVVEPRSFEDSIEIVNHLKTRKSVIVNLQYLDHELSQRVIDFVSGATFALDGTQERVGHGVFIFASMNCRVETENEGSRAYKDIFSRSLG